MNNHKILGITLIFGVIFIVIAAILYACMIDEDARDKKEDEEKSRTTALSLTSLLYALVFGVWIYFN